MAKVIRWRGQFADIEKTQYTVEIYGDDNGSGVKTITLGSNPLITEEDDNDDLFTPIRTQTGTLEVLDPDGTLMEEMLPADNLDHPVRVKRGSEIVWQGFMSCEAYSQDYTSREQVVEFNLKSYLAVMEYSHISQPIDGWDSIKGWIGRAVGSVGFDENDVIYPDSIHAQYWDYFHEYQYDENFFDAAYIQGMVFFSIEDTEKEDGAIEKNVVSCSAKDVLSKIARYLCCVVRESGTKIYFQPIRRNLQSGQIRKRMTDFTYLGANHSISTLMPARSTKVVAPVRDTDLSVNMPEIPKVPALYDPADMYDIRTDILVQRKNDSYTTIETKQISIPITWSNNTYTVGTGTYTTWENPDNRIAIYNRAGAYGIVNKASTTLKAGSYFAVRRIRGKFTDCIICTVAPVASNVSRSVKDVLVMRMPIRYKFASQHAWSRDKRTVQLKLTAHVDAFGPNKAISDTYHYSDMNSQLSHIKWPIAIKIGINPAAYEYVDVDEQGNISKTFSLPNPSMTSYLYGGDVQVCFGDHIRIDNFTPGDSAVTAELNITSLKLELSGDTDFFSRHNSSNIYGGDVISNNYGEDIVSTVDMAVDNNNFESPMLLQTKFSNYLTTANYITGTGTISKIPEKMLADTLKSYYSKHRQVISIEVKTQEVPLPTIYVISDEGDWLYNVFESEHDWRLGNSTLKLIETI